MRRILFCVDYPTIHFFCSSLLFALSLSLILFILGKAVSKKSGVDRELQRPFECGFRTFNDFRLKFRLRFFLVALVFIIFDVELIIIFPYFISIRVTTPLASVVLLTILLFVLTFGLFNEWNQMILEWIK